MLGKKRKVGRDPARGQSCQGEAEEGRNARGGDWGTERLAKARPGKGCEGLGWQKNTLKTPQVVEGSCSKRAAEARKTLLLLIHALLELGRAMAPTKAGGGQ